MQLDSCILILYLSQEYVNMRHKELFYTAKFLELISFKRSKIFSKTVLSLLLNRTRIFDKRYQTIS